MQPQASLAVLKLPPQGQKLSRAPTRRQSARGAAKGTAGVHQMHGVLDAPLGRAQADVGIP